MPLIIALLAVASASLGALLPDFHAPAGVDSIAAVPGSPNSRARFALLPGPDLFEVVRRGMAPVIAALTPAESNPAASAPIVEISTDLEFEPAADPFPGEETWLDPARPSFFPTQEGFLGSGFGWRNDPFTGRTKFHAGQDIVADRGTPVLAPADGRVIAAGRSGGLGLAIFLAHADGIVTRFGHLSRVAVRPGERVGQGQVIGNVGASGRAIGSHLHYEVMVSGDQVDPRRFLPPEAGEGVWSVPSAPIFATADGRGPAPASPPSNLAR